jgi:hypothetical protein
MDLTKHFQSIAIRFRDEISTKRGSLFHIFRKHKAQGFRRRNDAKSLTTHSIMEAAANPYAKGGQRMGQVVNPYAKSGPPAHKTTMGPQSQRRISQQQRTHRMQANNTGYRKRKKGDQQTLTGEIAFDPIKDCPICKARHIGYAEPHRGHHRLCWNNKRTKGITSATTLASQKESIRLQKHFSEKLKPHEKLMGANNTKAAAEAFFAPKNELVQHATKMSSPPVLPTTLALPKANDFCIQVGAKVKDEQFQMEHKAKGAPLAILALAAHVVEHVVRHNDKQVFDSFFTGCTMTVPPANNMHQYPHYHSIVGQKLLLVDWKRTHGVEIPCTTPTCTGIFKNDRTNFSKNKTLFPVFNIASPPSWAMVMLMVCPCCKRRVYANDSEVLCQLPDYVAASYPVDNKYAMATKSCQVAKNATDVFDHLMTTYGNGDLCSRLLYNAINKSYLERVTSYYSYSREH